MSASHRTFLLGGVGLATLASLALAAPASAQDRADPDQQDDGVEEAVADYIDGANPPPPGGEREIGEGGPQQGRHIEYHHHYIHGY